MFYSSESVFLNWIIKRSNKGITQMDWKQGSSRVVSPKILKNNLIVRGTVRNKNVEELD